MRNRRARAFTLVEMCVAMAVMGIVMSVAALEFKAVVYTHLFETSHLSAQQQARIAMAKIGGIARQASVDDQNPQPNATSPPPAVSEPLSTPGPRFVFTQVACLGTDPLHCLPVKNGVPTPCYNKVQLYLQSQVGEVGGTLWEQADPNDAGGNCPGFDYSHMPLLIARNVEGFQVSPIPNDKNTYQVGYRVDLTIFGYDDHSIDSRAGASYHLQTVITPIVFGESL